LAQVAAVENERRGGSVTTIGTPAADACAQFVVTGNTSDQALAMCDRALVERLSRTQVMAIRLHRGVLHLRRQEAEAALADFDAAIALDRRQPEAHQNRGAALVQLRRYGEAVSTLTYALGLGVDDPHKVYFNRGAAREALGDLRGAYEDYSTALEIQPDWGPAEEELARFARNRRDHLASRLSDEPTP
jgi:tetratricopeptide (TPR) repeat protein